MVLKNLFFHETSMKIPLANAIFAGDLDINNFYKEKNFSILENLILKK